MVSATCDPIHCEQRIPAQLFHDYATGGYLTLRLGPKYPDFADGRGIPFPLEVLTSNRPWLSRLPTRPCGPRKPTTTDQHHHSFAGANRRAGTRPPEAILREYRVETRLSRRCFYRARAQSPREPAVDRTVSRSTARTIGLRRQPPVSSSRAPPLAPTPTTSTPIQRRSTTCWDATTMPSTQSPTPGSLFNGRSGPAAARRTTVAGERKTRGGRSAVSSRSPHPSDGHRLVSVGAADDGAKELSGSGVCATKCGRPRPVSRRDVIYCLAMSISP